MKVLAVDPGGTSGYVRGEFDEDIEDAFERLDSVQLKNAGEWSGTKELYHEIVWNGDRRDMVSGGIFYAIDACVVERYVIYPNRAETHIGDDLYTAREIGKIEWLAFRFSSIGDVVFQAASQAKQRWPNRRLYEYYPGAKYISDHTKDALRHLLTFVETV